MSNVFDRIQRQISEHRVFLYMKGTPQLPMCGFSARAAGILQQCGVPFGSANVLDDPELREAIKQFSQWPTVPQLYVGGEFVGGSDIMSELYQSGELQKMLGGEQT